MRKKIGQLTFVLLMSVGMTCAQTPASSNLATLKYQFKVGVLPFIDASGNLGDKGTAIARLLQSELAHGSDLEVRFIKPTDDSGSDIDSEQAVSLAREHKNDVVILATVLSAEAQESDHSAGA